MPAGEGAVLSQFIDCMLAPVGGAIRAGFDSWVSLAPVSVFRMMVRVGAACAGGHRVEAPSSHSLKPAVQRNSSSALVWLGLEVVEDRAMTEAVSAAHSGQQADLGSACHCLGEIEWSLTRGPKTDSCRVVRD